MRNGVFFVRYRTRNTPAGHSTNAPSLLLLGAAVAGSNAFLEIAASPQLVVRVLQNLLAGFQRQTGQAQAERRVPSDSVLSPRDRNSVWAKTLTLLRSAIARKRRYKSIARVNARTAIPTRQCSILSLDLLPYCASS